MNTKRILLLSFAMTAPLLLFGQGTGPEGPRAPERVEQLRKVRMIEALDLTEEQSIRFFARLNEHEKEKQVMMDEKSAVLDKLERLLRNDADPEEYGSLFPMIAKSDEALLKEDERFFESLGDILSESQRAKFLLFGRQFHRELQDALRFMHRRRQGP